jgi:hypothetical protein
MLTAGFAGIMLRAVIIYSLSAVSVTEFGDFVWLDVGLIILLLCGMISSNWDAAIGAVKP